MLTNDQAVKNVFDSVKPSLTGATSDFITVMLVMIGFALIGLAFYYVKSLFNFHYGDGILSVEKRDFEEEEFESDRQEYNWLDQNDEKSDAFVRAVGKAKQKKLIRKWS